MDGSTASYRFWCYSITAALGAIFAVYFVVKHGDWIFGAIEAAFAVVGTRGAFRISRQFHRRPGDR